MSNLQELLERVEKAEGGDRAIDTALELLLLSATTKEFPGADPRSGLVLILDAKERWVTCDADEYTASIDATVALVEKMATDPREVSVSGLMQMAWGDVAKKHNLHMRRWDNAVDGSYGPALALALIAALLRAMIAKEKE